MLVDEWNLWGLLGGAVAAAAVIVVAGSRLSLYADSIGDRWEIGKTVVGALVLGAATSLPGIVASVMAALEGRPVLAASNAVGGIAAQTAFLVIADFCYRRANLEHDAADVSNIAQTILLLTVLLVTIASSSVPLAQDWAVHPTTPLLVSVYVIGLVITGKAAKRPMWHPAGGEISGVNEAVDEAKVPGSAFALIAWTIVCAILVALSGWMLMDIAVTSADRYGFNSALVGAAGTAVVTSLPELVTTIAAVRRGALSLAVGGIMGGNAFDVLFLAAADAAYVQGSIYHEVGALVAFQLAVSAVMACVLLMGLSLRQQEGPGNIGVEGMVVLGLYGIYIGVIAIWP